MVTINRFRKVNRKGHGYLVSHCYYLTVAYLSDACMADFLLGTTWCATSLCSCFPGTAYTLRETENGAMACVDFTPQTSKISGICVSNINSERKRKQTNSMVYRQPNKAQVAIQGLMCCTWADSQKCTGAKLCSVL
jgi:hypothetical protein